MRRYTLRHSWPITEDGLDMTREELQAEAMEPGGPFDLAVIEHGVRVVGEARWEMDTVAARDGRLVVEVPVVDVVAPLDRLPGGHPLRSAA